MTNMSFEEMEMLNELRRQERFWKIVRWILPVIAVWILFDKSLFNDPVIIRAAILGALAGRLIGHWKGDPKTKLLIKLYEEIMERKTAKEIS